MSALDTNVLIRFLVADDARQFEIAKAYIESVPPDETLFVPLSVSIELEWVLRSRYEMDKDSIISIYIQLLESREIAFQEEDSIEVALSFYSDNNADFADCVHLAVTFTHHQTPLMTFDRKASKLSGVKLLS